MVSEDILLRALDIFFRQDTLIAFLMTIFFLMSHSFFKARIMTLGVNRWVASFLSAWLAAYLGFTVFFTVDYLANYIDELRTPWMHHSPKPGEQPYPEVVLIFFIYSACIAFLFLIYEWVKGILLGAVQRVPLRLALESVLPFLLLFLFIILSSFIMGGSYSMELPELLAGGFSTSLNIAIAVLIYNFLVYATQLKVKEKELQISKLRQQVAQSKLDELSSKINPHFLYNSLNSIAGLSIEEGSKAREMAIALSKLFRYNINREESSYASIREEVEMVLLYLEIEKIRFEERLQYSCTIQPGLEEDLIPKHLLQPLVENAVKHGMKNEGVTVNLVIEKLHDSLLISISDTGNAFVPDFNPGYGLISLYEKMDILAKGKYNISFLNDPKSVRIEIKNVVIAV
jgi:hypothetical protein